MKSIFIITTVFIILLLFSCSDNSSNSPNTIGNPNIYLGHDTTLTFSDLVSDYDTTDMMGSIYLTNEYEKILLNDPTNEIDYNTNNAHAYFFDPDDQDSILPCEGIYVNNQELLELHSGSKHYITSGDISGGTGLTLNFGSGTNYISIDSNQFISEIDTNIAFSQKIRISNISRGDTILKSNNITINWTGNNSGYVSLTLHNSVDTNFTSFYCGHALLTNSGSFTISSDVMDNFPDGLHDLILTKFEPKFILLDNGNKVLVMGESTHKISVFLD